MSSAIKRDLEDGEEAWGFMPRDPHPDERPAAYKAFFSQYLPIFVFDGLIGALCSLLGILIQTILQVRRSGWLEVLTCMIAVLLILALGLLLVLISGLFSFIGGLPLVAWLGGLAVGLGVVMVTYALLKQARRRPAAGQGLTP
jgi:hypothetical protein